MRKLVAIAFAAAVAAVAKADELGSLPKNDLVNADSETIVHAALADGHAFFAEEKDYPEDFKNELPLLRIIGEHHADHRGLVLGQRHIDYALAFMLIVEDDAKKAGIAVPTP